MAGGRKTRRAKSSESRTGRAAADPKALEAGVLSKVLATCRPFAGSRASLLPIMQHFLLTPTHVAATDGRVGILHAMRLQPTSTTVPAETMTQLVASFPQDAPVHVSVPSAGATRLQIGRHMATLAGYDPADFPAAMPPPKGLQKPLPTGMYDAAKLVAFAASLDDTRIQLNGTWFRSDETVVAIDGNRVAWGKAAGARSLFIPAWLLARVAGWPEGPERYALDAGGKLWLLYPDRAVYAVMPEVAFPDTEAIIADAEKVCKTAVGFRGEREHLLAAVRRLLLLAEGEECRPIRLTVKRSQVRFEAKDTTGHSMVEDVAVQTLRVAKDVVGSVNGRYLLEAIERFEEFFLGPTMLMAFADSRKFGHAIMRLQDEA